MVNEILIPIKIPPFEGVYPTEYEGVAGKPSLNGKTITGSQTAAYYNIALQNDLDAEIARATAAEEANTTLINNEIARATAPNTIQSQVAAEKTRAKTAEQELTTKLNNVTLDDTKQDKLKAGAGINITNNVISANDYSNKTSDDFTHGANSTISAELKKVPALEYVTLTPNTSSAAYDEGALSTKGDWCAICYGNGKYVTVDRYSANVAVSTDGVTWSITNGLGSSNQWNGLCYGNGKFVAVGLNKIMVSTDGVTWTQKGTISDLSDYERNICYGDGKFIVLVSGKYYHKVSNDGTDDTIVPAETYISTDAETWTKYNTGIYASLTAICYGGGKYVAVGATDYIYDSVGGTMTQGIYPAYAAVSTDGITWTQETCMSGYMCHTRKVVYGNGVYIAVFTNGRLARRAETSSAWTVISYGEETVDASALCFDGTRFCLAIFNSDSILTSTDGQVWSMETMPKKSTWSAGIHGLKGTVFVAGSLYEITKVTSGKDRVLVSSSSTVTLLRRKYNYDVLSKSGKVIARV